MSKSTEHYNNFTKDLDSFLIKKLQGIRDYFDGEYSYLWLDDIKLVKEGKRNHVAFRAPGATRGHIEVGENMIITDIKFYEDTCGIYEGDYEKILKEKYIETKLEVE